ncbi:GIY-YIG nuclease family protein [Oscillochloris sp. ZM17-4]|uniref:GIY-YIG nuclease family protein n=1 Tax=Oscillochloris sp. ZM17-4 TaxID=2866714 RepID=UPI001C72B940|nr:GIY-YIG nuclease family protein [Oscillochloris sp. ZM17-4]MBX0331389.1 GIY-YIG nuclease family protein [Oscillochloris sp. ZM17-4]
MIAGYQDFEFDLPGALLARLVEVLDEMISAPLDSEPLDNIPEAQGVYQLFLDGQLVYIGKTDAEAGLSRRLRRHYQKIQYRAGLDPSRVSFKAVRIYVFTAVDLETQLIAHYGGLSQVQWNGSGFGSNDPGRERDTTKFKDDHFDARYPIDIDRVLDIALPSPAPAASYLAELKRVVPYVFRFEAASARSRAPHADLVSTSVSLPVGLRMTPRAIIAAVVSQLPSGWQAIQFPSHVILYKNDVHYKYGSLIARS